MNEHMPRSTQVIWHLGRLGLLALPVSLIVLLWTHDVRWLWTGLIVFVVALLATCVLFAAATEGDKP